MCFCDKHVCEMEGKLWGSGETWYERSQLQMSQLQSVTSACSMFLLEPVLNRTKDGQQGQHGTCQQKSGASKVIPRAAKKLLLKVRICSVPLAHPSGSSGLRFESHGCTQAEHRKAAAMRTSMRSREGRRDQLRVWHQLPPTSLAKWQNMCAKRKENFVEGGETWYERSQLQISQLLTRTLRSTHLEAPHRHRRRLNHLHDRRV